MNSYCEFHASECHTTTRYEVPACMTEVKPKPAFAHATTRTPGKIGPNYPAYLLRTFNGVLCETL